MCCKQDGQAQFQAALLGLVQDIILASSKAAVNFPLDSEPAKRIEPGKVLFFISFTDEITFPLSVSVAME